MANAKTTSLAVAWLDAPLDYYTRYTIPLSDFMAKAEPDELEYVFQCMKAVQEHPIWKDSANLSQFREQPHVAFSLNEGRSDYFYIIVKCENNGSTFIVGLESIIANINVPNEIMKIEI